MTVRMNKPELKVTPINNYKMNKTNLFRHTAAAALAVMTAGMFAFSSCDQLALDETGLQDSIDDLTDRVESLEEKVATLEEQAAVVSGLLENGKIISGIAENADGTGYIISYVGEEAADEIIVSAGHTEITVIQDGEDWYWAKIGENGEPEYLLGEENKIAVEQVIPQFKIENNSLMVSVDGTEWTDTGITLGEAGLSLISDVKVEDDYVEFIYNGNGGSFQVKRVTELKCEFLSGKTIFEYDEMKNLSMDVSGYVKYDIDYPEGWTVEFDGTKMSVTAPAAPSEWNQTPFDESGLIKIWLYDNKGDVVFDKVMVQIGGTQMVTLSATMTEGVVNVVAETPYASSFYLGVMKADEFTAEAAAEAANAPDATRYETSEEETEDGWLIIPFSAPFTDFYAEPEVGESYVIWAFQENYGEAVSPEDIITIVYDYGLNVDAAFSEITFKDATVTVTPAEGTSYFYGITTKDDYYASSILYMVNAGMYSATSEAVNSTMSELSASDEPNVRFDITPGASYTLWYVIKTSTGSYTEADIKTVEVTLGELTDDGSAVVEFGEPTITHNSIEVPFTRPENTWRVYATYMTEAEYISGYESSDDKVQETLLNSWPFNTDYPTTEDIYGNFNLSPNTKGYVFVVVIDNDGKIGPLQKKEVTTTDVPRDASIGVALDGTVEATASSASVKLSVTGTPTTVIYYIAKKSDFENSWSFKGDKEIVKSDMALNPNNYNYTRVAYSDLTDNTLKITGLSFSQDYILIGSVASGDESTGYTLSADYFVTEFTTPAPNIIGTDDPGYAGMLPEISEPSYETSYGSTYGKLTVTPAEGTATWYYYATTTALDESDTAALVSQITSNGNSSTEQFEINKYMYTTVYVYITWTDAEGNYYAPVKVEIPMPA